MKDSKQSFNLLAGLQQRERGGCSPRSFMQKALICRLKVDYGVISDPNASVEYLEKLYDRYDQDYQIFRRQVSESESAEGLLLRLFTGSKPPLYKGEKGLGLLTEILNKREAGRACQEVNRDGIGSTPLHSAVILRNSALINAILKRLGDKIVKVCRADRGIRNSPLHKAAEYGDEAAVNEILEQLGVAGAEICRQSDNCGFTPLHCACISGNAAVIKTILSKLGDTTTYGCREPCRLLNGEICTPIHFVVEKGSEDIVKAMFDQVGDEFLRRCGWELLCRAAKGGNAAALRLLFDRLGDAATDYCLKEEDESRRTLLFYAAEGGSADAFKVILKQLGGRGAEICQRKTMFDGTPLYKACEKGNAAVIEVIINQLSEVFGNADKQGLLSLVVKSGKIEAVNLILEQFGDEAAGICQQNGAALLRNAVLSRSVAVVDRMLKLFGDRADEICQQDIRLLVEAASSFNPAITKTIFDQLGNKANEACQERDQRGHNPLHLIVGIGDAVGVNTILEKEGVDGAEVCQQKDKYGQTLLHMAARFDVRDCGKISEDEYMFVQTIIVESIFRHLGEQATNICQESGYMQRTPLHWAANSGNGVVVNMILEQLGRDKAAKVCQAADKNGSTPLDLAINSGYWDAVKPFLGILGDEVKAEEDKLIELARKSRNLACLEQLSNYFKELNSENHIHL